MIGRTRPLVLRCALAESSSTDSEEAAQSVVVKALGLPEITNFVPGASPTPEELEQMTLLYAFDMVVQNPDRRLDNPNCAILDGKLVPFDFETCFSFLLALGQPDPGAISKHGLARQHCCHEILSNRKRSISWSPFRAALASVTDQELTELVTAVPDAWQKPANKVRSHLISVRDQLATVELELQRSLS
jgi:hypothetical protein